MSVTFSKSITPPWVFFTFFKLCRWYQIMQSITYAWSPVENRMFHKICATFPFTSFNTFFRWITHIGRNIRLWETVKQDLNITLCLIFNVIEYLQNHLFWNTFRWDSFQGAFRFLSNIRDGAFAKIINDLRPLNTLFNIFLESHVKKLLN